MKKAIIPYGISLVFLLSFMLGCVSTPTPSPEETARQFMFEKSEGLSENQAAVKTGGTEAVGQLPVRYQKPAYMLSRPKVSGDDGQIGEFILPVGADISTPAGPKPLGSIIGQIVAMKNMSVSYATDVDQNALITVNVRADQDFFGAIENILRPLDYFYEVNENTIIIKHKETRQYHIAAPFINSIYSTSVGGNVLGASDTTNMDGTLAIESTGNKFDIWGNIQTNLDKILEIWTEKASGAGGSSSSGDDSANDDEARTSTDSTRETTSTQADEETGRSTAFTITQRAAGKGYYTIDEHIGLINVTAPRSLLVKIENYLDNFKSELYKQISIEAKIVEVTLTEDNTTGLDWSDLLESAFNWDVSLGPLDQLNVVNLSNITNGTIGASASVSFATVLDLMQDQGHVEVLSNPKISVINGQPAMISVGQNLTYIDEVSSDVDGNTGTRTFTANTASIMSGIGMGVIGNILDDNEIVLSITPVITSLVGGEVDYEVFGANNELKIGVPRVDIREMNTIVRVKDGEMLIIGGLIEDAAKYDNNKVAGLGDLPVVGKMFRTDGTASSKKELIILLRPKIISMQ